MGSCGGEDGSPEGPGPIITNEPDTIPPAAIDDFRLRYPSYRSFALVWTAPGDDVLKGQAATYDIRYSNSAISEDNWDDATPVDPQTIPIPKPGGQVETIVVLGLDSGTEYFFAIKTADEVPNVSALSNCPSNRTLDESIPPADITDLAATAVDESSFELTWTAPGDDGKIGTAAGYDIRYAATPIDDEISWAAAISAAGFPDPLAPGETETFVVTDLAPATSYFFAIKTADELENWSGLSNTAPALAIGSDFWITPKTVARGHFVHILFRTDIDDNLSVYVFNDGAWVECDRDDLILDVLAEGPFPAGVHMLTYDFFDRLSDDYFPEDYYLVLVCREHETVFRDFVHFVH
jgi:hypothetical protein